MKRTSLLPAITDWGDVYAATFIDAQLWRPVVQAVCRRHGVAPAVAISAGFPGTCPVFSADDQVVVKFFPPMVAADYERELIVYEWLAGGPADLATPRLLAHAVYHDRIDWPYFIMSFLPGRVWREVRLDLPPAARRAAVVTLGRWLRRLHERPLAGLPFAAGADAFLAARRATCLSELKQRRPALSAALIDELDDLLTVEMPALAAARPVLVHADLTADHLFWQPSATGRGGWQLTGIIDWADAEITVPDYEWVPLWFDPLAQAPELLTLLLTAYYDRPVVLDERWARRLLAVTLLHRFGALIIDERLSRPPPDLAAMLVDLFPWLAAAGGVGPARS